MVSHAVVGFSARPPLSSLGRGESNTTYLVVTVGERLATREREQERREEKANRGTKFEAGKMRHANTSKGTPKEHG